MERDADTTTVYCGSKVELAAPGVWNTAASFSSHALVCVTVVSTEGSGVKPLFIRPFYHILHIEKGCSQ